MPVHGFAPKLSGSPLVGVRWLWLGESYVIALWLAFLTLGKVLLRDFHPGAKHTLGAIGILASHRLPEPHLLVCQILGRSALTYSHWKLGVSLGAASHQREDFQITPRCRPKPGLEVSPCGGEPSPVEHILDGPP